MRDDILDIFEEQKKETQRYRLSNGILWAFFGVYLIYCGVNSIIIRNKEGNGLFSMHLYLDSKEIASKNIIYGIFSVVIAISIIYNNKKRGELLFVYIGSLIIFYKAYTINHLFYFIELFNLQNFLNGILIIISLYNYRNGKYPWEIFKIKWYYYCFWLLGFLPKMLATIISDIIDRIYI